MPRLKLPALSTERLRALALSGADQALKRLRAEIVAIERAFPELALPQGRRAVKRSVRTAATQTRKMSAEARKVVSTRMKRYWAARRKAKTKAR